MSVIYIDSYRFGVSGPTDPYFSNVALLLHGDGTNGSTTIVDNSPSPKTVTAVGNAQISTAQSKFGGSSIAFDGTGDYLSIPPSSAFDYTSSDFTWECWTYFNTVGGLQTIISDARYISGGNLMGFVVRVSNGVVGGLGYSNQLSPFVIVGNQTSLSANSWYHLAFTRSGNDYRLFLNGVQEGSTVQSGTAVTYDNDDLTVGAWEGFIGSRDLDGYIDDLRVTKGVARYTANFTPPTAPFPNS